MASFIWQTLEAQVFFCDCNPLTNHRERKVSLYKIRIRIPVIRIPDRVNHLGILYMLCSVGIGGSVLSILTQFLSTDHITLWWIVVGVNCLTLYQECHRAVFWARYCSSSTLRSFFHFGK